MLFRPGVSLTFNNAQTVLQAGLRAIADGQAEFDLSEVAVVDSAAIATMLAWQRAARKAGRTLAFHNLPANLHSLVKLYGVGTLLQLAAGDDHPHH
jgi:phospholipid transport system transporter-binding protein